MVYKTLNSFRTFADELVIVCITGVAFLKKYGTPLTRTNAHDIVQRLMPSS